MAERLTAWLYGRRVLELSPAPEYRMSVRWHEEGVDRWGNGSRILSVSMPLGSPTGVRDLRGLDFFENLLPEGPALGRLAALARVPAADAFGILAAFGRDCAGAIVLLPDGESPDSGGGGYLPVSEQELLRVLNDLPAMPLGADPDRGFRPSLAGFQGKALVGRAADGSWQRPQGNAPSTWILKPDGPHAFAANEATCMKLAASCGLNPPETELLQFGGRAVLAVKRYDRVEQGGEITRLHQEDGCQATAKPPALKYEEHGGPPLRALATVLRDFGDPRDVTDLLRRTVFNVAVGNSDAHAKNFSLVHYPGDPVVRLAPPYDVLSTLALELADEGGRVVHADTHLGQRVGGESDIRKVSAANLADEAARWGIRHAAGGVIADMLDRVIAAAGSTPGDERVLGVIRRQAERIAATRD